jgi:hypothetical protein
MMGTVRAQVPLLSEAPVPLALLSVTLCQLNRRDMQGRPLNHQRVG